MENSLNGIDMKEVIQLAKKMDSTKQWMSDLRKEKPLFETATLRDIVIPGTHDSGAYDMKGLISVKDIQIITKEVIKIDIENIFALLPTDKLTRKILNLSINFFVNFIYDSINDPINQVGFIKKISKCQELSIYEQLIRGARYLDLRVDRTVDGKLFIVHGDCLTNISLDNALKQILDFMEVYDEIIMIDIKSGFDDVGMEQDLLDSIISLMNVKDLLHSGSNLMALPKNGPNLESRKLADLWSTGRIVIGYPNIDKLKSDLCDYSHFFWPRVKDTKQTWANTESVTTLKDKCFENVKNPPIDIWLLQCQLTPQTTSVVFCIILFLIPNAFIALISKLPWPTNKWVEYLLKPLTGLLNQFPLPTPALLAAKSNPQVDEWFCDDWSSIVNVLCVDFIERSSVVETAIKLNVSRFEK